MSFIKKRILVTGGNGFLGKHLVRQMQERGYRNIAVADHSEYNLVNLNDIQRMYEGLKPDIVIHLAAKVGGIGFNQQNPASLFYENAMMGIQLIHEGYLRKIEKFVALGTICAYPKFTPVPFMEDDIWNGYPEETNAPYGLAKKMMLVQSQAYRRQYGFNSIFLLPVNLYGPGDNFTFKSSHVIPALIRKFHLASLLAEGAYDAIIKDFLINKDDHVTVGNKEFVINETTPRDDLLKVLRHYGIYPPNSFEPDKPDKPDKPEKLDKLDKLDKPEKLEKPYKPYNPFSTVEVWGSGKATREFFYVEDAAEAIVLATEKYDKSDPVNIGAGFEISIKDLVSLIVELTDFKGKVVWDKAKPDGQPRRMLDTARASREFGFKAKTNFRGGLSRTIAWYKQK